MLVALAAQERTRDEFSRLLQGAGFRMTDVVPAAANFWVIEAVPA